jgi:hypothetical protein
MKRMMRQQESRGWENLVKEIIGTMKSDEIPGAA